MIAKRLADRRVRTGRIFCPLNPKRECQTARTARKRYCAYVERGTCSMATAETDQDAHPLLVLREMA